MTTPEPVTRDEILATLAAENARLRLALADTHTAHGTALTQRDKARRMLADVERIAADAHDHWQALGDAFGRTHHDYRDRLYAALAPDGPASPPQSTQADQNRPDVADKANNPNEAHRALQAALRYLIGQFTGIANEEPMAAKAVVWRTAAQDLHKLLDGGKIQP